jgi:hypothetical protein
LVSRNGLPASSISRRTFGLGENDKAREWFAKAEELLKKCGEGDGYLKRSRAEAAELLGLDKKDQVPSR